MWLACLLTLWAMAVTVASFLFAMDSIIAPRWLLMLPTLLIGWWWFPTRQAGRRTP